MSKPNKTPMTPERASAIQRTADLKPNPSPKQMAFKAKAASAAAKNKSK
ncbi:hypothetical protein [Novilysobacter spongiicola]|uniref:Uncharacterized protein n=1 Tax=Lysobacter spongiicola DSM 21749 TaxID=1122188 RepID=A0A1T4RYP8_9GAMM|nr:hypothetical protein [Lysobacter spongiicola]SKA21129.1 hypothetical protein SAMN02745674_02450 [Lysobacter spongiicola DSM 21749]